MFNGEHRDQRIIHKKILVPFLENLYLFLGKGFLCLLIFGLSASVKAQNCNVSFPAASDLLYSSECGGMTAENLTLGGGTGFFGDGDVFTFDAPNTINLSGNTIIRAEGSGKLVIPAGVTVNVNGNLIIQKENGGCRSNNSCNFKLEINGTLNVTGNFQSFIYAAEWSGLGTVLVNGNFEYSDCMRCSLSSCPAFPNGNCNSIGNTCGSSFCNSGNIGNSCPVGVGIVEEIVNVPDDILIQGCSQSVSWDPPEPTIDCRVQSFSGTHDPGDIFPEGTTTVTYTMIDTADAVFTRSFDITIEDTEDPVISNCPGDLVLQLSASSCTRSGDWTPPSGSDNCGLASLTSPITPSTQLPLGTTVVEYTATDNFGNQSTCSFSVTIEDNIDPVISNIPADITVSARPDLCSEVVEWPLPTATDNCTLLTFSPDIPWGSVFSLGTTTVTYTAMDQSNNTAMASFNVTVVDDSGPVFQNCPVDIIQSSNSNNCEAIVLWDPIQVVDNCTSFSLTSTHNSGDSFPIGTTLVTYVAEDGVGNISQCSFNVTIVDDTPPQITKCTEEVIIELSAGECTAINVTWNDPEATDNCGGFTATPSVAIGSDFDIGTTLVTYTLVDGSGNESSCSFNVVVNDNVSPVFSTCPDSQVIEAEGDACEIRVDWVPPVLSADCPNTTVTSTHDPGDLFATGVTEVVYTATDASGNSTECKFTITITDNIAPEFSFCPENIEVSNGDPTGTTVFWDDPIATDNCGEVEVKSSHEPGDAFRAGTTEVIYTAQDRAGNTTRCSFEVTVEIDGIFVYKSFTPDGDNINDTWRIENIEFYPENRVQVMDRWGTTVYEARGYNNENIYWDGIPNQGSGNVAPTGTYFYTIDLGDGSSPEQGFIELVR